MTALPPLPKSLSKIREPNAPIGERFPSENGVPPMASAPTRRCPRCRKLVKGPCVECTRKYKREWEKTRKRDRFLDSARWKRLRNAYRTEHPLCEPCLEAGQTTPCEEVHHKKARREHPELALDWENLLSVCKSCHTRLFTNRGT